MKFVYWTGGKGYEPVVAGAIADGARRRGDDVVVRHMTDYRGPEGDVGIISGITKREVMWQYQAQEIPFLYFDKGYSRQRLPWLGGTPPGWWRCVVNNIHPTDYFQDVKRPADRWAMLGLPLSARRTTGRNVLIAASSHKYHLALDMPHPTEWISDLAAKLHALTDRPIIYRPKPSWAHAEPVEGTIFDHEGKTPFSGQLENAWCVVTHGSMASVEAIAFGVPCIVLGPAIARPISSLNLGDIENPAWYDDATRAQWAHDLAYCHWRLSELADGTAWRTIREQLHAVAKI